MDGLVENTSVFEAFKIHVSICGAKSTLFSELEDLTGGAMVAGGTCAHLAGVVLLGDVIDAGEECLSLDRLGLQPGLAKGLGLLFHDGAGLVNH